MERWGWLGMGLVIACGSSGGGGGDSSGVDSSGDEASTAAMETTGGSSSDDASTDPGSTGPGSTGPGSTDPADSSDGSSGGDEEAHGTVAIDLRRAPSQDENPFVGTAEVEVVILYDECLMTFYDDRPEMRQDGAEGAGIFAEWVDRLCDDTTEHADCEVVSITQQFEANGAGLYFVFSVSGDLEDRRLRLGPLPTHDTAGCAMLPSVQLDGVRGRNADGDDIWSAESFSPLTAAVDQQVAFQVNAAVL